MPKALVPVAGKPMLERVILRLKEAGFNEITVNIHHFGEQIIDFLRAHDNFGTEIHISDERGMLLDTGGGIKKARPFLDGQEPFLVHNADILTDIDLAGSLPPPSGERCGVYPACERAQDFPLSPFLTTTTTCTAG